MNRELRFRRITERRKGGRPLWWLIVVFLLVLFLFRYLRTIAD
ncbi:MAG: hypothetical protein ACE5LH_06645 [Fidelibacterota bacterium]